MEAIEKAYRAAAEDHQWKPKGLTPQQESALNEIDDAVDVMWQWRGITPENDFEKRLLLADEDRYEKALTRAVRAGLWQHPIVREWLAARRSLGDWDELRRFRKGLERGVTKTMSKADFWLAFVAADLIKNGHEPEAIRKALIEKLKDPDAPVVALSVSGPRSSTVAPPTGRFQASSRPDTEAVLSRAPSKAIVASSPARTVID